MYMHTHIYKYCKNKVETFSQRNIFNIYENYICKKLRLLNPFMILLINLIIFSSLTHDPINQFNHFSGDTFIHHIYIIIYTSLIQRYHYKFGVQAYFNSNFMPVRAR